LALAQQLQLPPLTSGYNGDPIHDVFEGVRNTDSLYQFLTECGSELSWRVSQIKAWTTRIAFVLPLLVAAIEVEKPATLHLQEDSEDPAKDPPILREFWLLKSLRLEIRPTAECFLRRWLADVGSEMPACGAFDAKAVERFLENRWNDAMLHYCEQDDDRQVCMHEPT
jgi:hypothetical protein